MRDRRLRLGQGAAGRLAPGLLAVGVEKRRGRLARAEARLTPAAMGTSRRAAARAAGGSGRAAGAGGAAADPRGAGAARGAGRTLGTLGPAQVLARGYAVVRDGAGAVVTRAEAAGAAPALEVEFADGRVRVRPERRPERKAAAPEQGTLL